MIADFNGSSDQLRDTHHLQKRDDGIARSSTDPISLNANRSVSRRRFFFAPLYLEAF
jgi:hypothetical protein